MISDKCAERAVVGSTTVQPAADARSRCSVEIKVAESPNAGSRVEVPSRLDAAVPGLIREETIRIELAARDLPPFKRIV